MPKRVRRTFDACWTCRKRRVTCDGGRPHCLPCRKRDMTCEGYDIRLVWVNMSTGNYQTHSRRSLDFSRTWKDHKLLSEAELNHLLDPDQGCTCRLHGPETNPFGCFNIKWVEIEPFLPPPSPTLRIKTPMLLDRRKALLFDHYINHVAHLMVPVQGVTNPWRSTYPSMAVLSSSRLAKGLMHALLSQASFNLAALHNRDVSRQELYAVALEEYVTALADLRESLVEPAIDFGTAVALLLMLIHIEGSYTAETCHQWRQHLVGADGILARFVAQQPWLQTNDGWVVSQSLALCYNLCNIGSSVSLSSSPSTTTFLNAVCQRQEYAFTIGASGSTLRAIAVASQMRRSSTRESVEGPSCFEAMSLISQLSSPNADIEVDPAVITKLTSTARTQHLSAIHERMFRRAAILYIRREILQSTPREVKADIDGVLQDVHTLLELDAGNLSIWPIFIAGVEAFSTEQRAIIEQWFQYSQQSGVQNRRTARSIIWDNWQRHDAVVIQNGLLPGQAVIDWRKTQQDLGLDIFLC